MAIVRAVKSGNWSDPTTWNTGALPTSADDVYSNTFTVTIDVSPTVLSISNAATTGVTVGGTFVPNNGITLTCTGGGVLQTQVNQISASAFQSNLTVGQSCSIIGNVTGGINGGYGAINTAGGTLTITGNVTGGIGGFGSDGVRNASTGTIVITGTVTGGAGTLAHGANNASSGTITITGTCLGGSGTGSGANNASTGTLSHVGTVQAGTGAPGVSGSSPTQTTILTGPFLTTANGLAPVTATRWVWANNPVATRYEIRTANLATIRPLYTADSVGGNPAASNVRSGTVYGPAGELTGTCAVPPASAVGVGVPVDNTTGTAAIDGASIRSALGMASANLDTQLAAIPTTAAPSASSIAAAVWSAVTRTITGGTVDTLTNAPDVPTEAEIATAVRTELSTELGRIDASTSSRLAAVAYTAPPSVGDIAAAVWAAATRTLTTAFDSSTTIATAVWSAATRTLTSSTAPSAADNAAAVWGYSSGRTVTGGTVDTVTNSTPVDAGEIADAVRTELTPELARMTNAATTQEVGDIVEGALND